MTMTARRLIDILLHRTAFDSFTAVLEVAFWSASVP